MVTALEMPKFYTQSYALEISCGSDQGRVRLINEDNFGCDAAAKLMVLADGMGGCQAGEVASAIAVSTVISEIKNIEQPVSDIGLFYGDDLTPSMARACNAIEKSNLAIYEAGLHSPECAGMGTTIVMAQFAEDIVTVANVGDSRLYLLRGDVLQQLTVDHTVLQEQIELGFFPEDERQRVAARSMLTRALGSEPRVTVDVFEQQVNPDDLFLLCSDGLYDMLDDGEIHSILTKMDGRLGWGVEELLRRTLDQGGVDNVTLILARVISS
ncbi:PP2C family protein-serine/threonine phosphatase [Sulfurirhabdus autotrophica]|uniref:Protein phosphatase n=1 Tax=Sulfurirhabdus autotrophica TaxID=1706046 RepID=A0A4R3Y555_9PROT|nr:protein phosphatase 2C domain-containing protein [Sulfurirhabdus autotrophica]TCV87375.1 protein phosphatase [Sulfurirhabdus autotrophica]